MIYPTKLATAICGVFLVLAAGCASVPPPTGEMAVATAALSSASSAGAKEFAPFEMQTATLKLQQANQAMTRKDYAEARTLAEGAQVDAKLAETKAQAAKAAKAESVTKDDLRVLREELDRKTK